METLAREWAHQLQQCQYAGELVIAEKELTDLALKVRPDLFSTCRSHQTRTCMLVLAVNCMYYHHDEQGFWVHFCALMKLVDTPQIESWLGSILESQLLEFRFIHKRGSGPFRFVTPIREQCGITRSELPRFAELLSWLTGQYGWDGIRVMGQAHFADILSTRLQDGHLARFLRSAQGYAFVSDVARNVSQFQRNILTKAELTTLTGYRTGFFTELLRALSKDKPVSRQVSVPPIPRLMFISEFRQVGLCFEPIAAAKGVFKFNGKVVRENPLLLQDRDDYQATIAGARQDADGTWLEWEIPGWDPSKAPMALFHVDRGYVDHKFGIQPGEYFMLGRYQEPPPEEVRQGDYGMVELPFPNIELDAWRIVVTDTCDLSFLGIKDAPKTLPIDLITWSDTRSSLAGTLGNAMAFTGSLPPLIISRPELFTSNAVALFIDEGKGARRLFMNPKDNKAHIDVQAPSQGRVWVEPISRLREFAGRDMLCELHYHLLPECQIKWPNGLYAFEEQPEVLLITQATGLTLEMENATPLDKTGRRWRVNSNTTVAQGRIQARDFTVSIARRVYRASLRHRDGRLAAYLLSTHVQKGDAWILTGVPHENAVIKIADGPKVLPLGTLGVFNEAGECRFPATAIRDTNSKWDCPVGSLSVEHQCRTVPTGTLYIDCVQLAKWISESKEITEPSWTKLLDGPLRHMFDVTRGIRATPPRILPDYETNDALPEALQSFLKTVRACAVVFDNASLPESPDMSQEHVAKAHSEVAEEEYQLLMWYLKARDFVNAAATVCDITAEKLLSEYEDLSWNPPFPRWTEAVEKALAHIKDDDEAFPLIEEWKRDVEKGFRVTYTSRIANQKGGLILMRAWIQYWNNANYQLAINELDALIGNTSSPITDLAGILLVLCYMRKAQFESQPPIQVQSTNQKLRRVFDNLKEIVDLGAQNKVHARPILTELSQFVPFLPLRPEDAGMIAAVQGNEDFPDNAKDWLTCYYLMRLYDCGLTEQEPPHPPNLEEVLKQVPASPEKPRVINTLER